MSLVLDSSAALAWAYSDEGSEAIDDVVDRVTRSGAWVPAIWRLEVANGLEHGVRRGRIDREMRDAILRDFSDLDIAVAPDTNEYAWTATLALAERFHLTLYDAAYVELARRRSIPLTSLDSDMRGAAKSLDIPLLGL